MSGLGIHARELQGRENLDVRGLLGACGADGLLEDRFRLGIARELQKDAGIVVEDDRGDLSVADEGAVNLERASVERLRLEDLAPVVDEAPVVECIGGGAGPIPAGPFELLRELGVSRVRLRVLAVEVVAVGEVRLGVEAGQEGRHGRLGERRKGFGRAADHRLALVREETELAPARQAFGARQRMLRVLGKVGERLRYECLGAFPLSAHDQGDGQRAANARPKSGVVRSARELLRALQDRLRLLEPLGVEVLHADAGEKLRPERIVASELFVDDASRPPGAGRWRRTSAPRAPRAEEEAQELARGGGPGELGLRGVALLARFVRLPEDRGGAGERRDQARLASATPTRCRRTNLAAR